MEKEVKNEIEKILYRLERIDHKEYKGGFEFADEADFEEMGRCFEERKKLAYFIINLKKELEEIEDIEDE